jgi:soluble lytic murein transglycosylase-like protein
MNIRFSLLSGALLVFGMTSIPASAEDKIQAVVDSSGRVVFTNLIESAPTTSRVSETTDSPQQMPASLDALVTSISTTHGVDPALVRAVIKTESNYNRWAVSRKGALGLMQLIPSTGRQYGVRDFFDPQQNIDGGVRYLKFLLQKFNGDLDLSLAAYNAGENAVERLGRIPSIPETTNYVRKIRSIYKGKSAPVLATNDAPAITPASAPEPPKIFKVIDARGVQHFSNIEPPN